MAVSIAATVNARADGARPAPIRSEQWLGAAAIGSAWLILVLGPLAGPSGLIDQHVLMGTGALTPADLPGFLAGWSLMVAAMMLPASLPAMLAVRDAEPAVARRRAAGPAILGTYLAAWAALGIAGFVALAALRSVVTAVPGLEANPSLVVAAALAAAGAYQLSPLKRRALAACRHPALRTAARRRSGIALGVRHAVDSVACSWAVMLALLVTGVGDPWSMAGLAGLMTYETVGRAGPRVASIGGRLMIGLAALVLVIGALPGPGVA